GGSLLPVGQSRRGGLRRPGPLRHHPYPEPTRRVRWRWTALLPRCLAGPPGVGGAVPRAADPAPRHPLDGGTRAGRVQLRQPRRAAGVHVRTGGSAMPHRVALAVGTTVLVVTGVALAGVLRFAGRSYDVPPTPPPPPPPAAAAGDRTPKPPGPAAGWELA